MSNIIMPFGKYLNKRLDDIPLKYLDWLIGQSWLSDPLKTDIEEYLDNPVIQRALEAELNE